MSELELLLVEDHACSQHNNSDTAGCDMYKYIKTPLCLSSLYTHGEELRLHCVQPTGKQILAMREAG